MSPISTLKHLCVVPLRSQLLFLQSTKAYSSRSGPYGTDSYDPADLEAAWQWYSSLNTNTIPRKIAHTRFDQGSGPGGQKVNKTSSKATTQWPLKSLEPHVPKILRPKLRDSRYCAKKSDSLIIQCSSFRSQSENENETHARLVNEIKELFKTVPGITPPEQAEKIRKLQKAENDARLRMKKKHSDKKSARSGGGRFD